MNNNINERIKEIETQRKLLELEKWDIEEQVFFAKVKLICSKHGKISDELFIKCLLRAIEFEP